MKIELLPIHDGNREEVLHLSVRKDQPFLATNSDSLKEAEEYNAENPGVARPFAIYADGKLVGFCMFYFSPDEEENYYYLWRFMIDKSEQGKGYGQAALAEIIKYYRENGADKVYVTTAPENTCGIHVYHNAGFQETGEFDEDGDVELMLVL